MRNQTGTAVALLLCLSSLCSFILTKSSVAAGPASLLEITQINWEYQRISGVAEITDGGEVIIEIRRLAAEKNFEVQGLQEKDGYIAVDLLLAPEEDGLFIKSLVQAALENQGGEGLLYLELVGMAEGRLSQEECQRLADTIYRCQGGRIHSGQKGDGLFSLHGYAKSVDALVMVNGMPVNISLAAAYDEVFHCTRFYLGIPLIRENY